jgi:hypothetical protein
MLLKDHDIPKSQLPISNRVLYDAGHDLYEFFTLSHWFLGSSKEPASSKYAEIAQL